MASVRRRRRGVLLVLVAALAAATGLVVDATGALRTLEEDTIDARFRVRSDDTRPRDVVVLGMDAETVHRLQAGRPPLPRRLHARAIAALSAAGAKRIAYDIEFVGRTTRR